MQRWFTLVGLAFAVVVASGCSIEAGHALIDLVHGSQESGDAFEWRGAIAAGDVIEIKGINGAIRASATSGDQVEVVAEAPAGATTPPRSESRSSSTMTASRSAPSIPAKATSACRATGAA